MLVNEWGWDSRKSDKPANDCRRNCDFSEEQSTKNCQPKTQLGTPDNTETVIEAVSPERQVDCKNEKNATASRKDAGMSRVCFPIHA